MLGIAAAAGSWGAVFGIFWYYTPRSPSRTCVVERVKEQICTQTTVRANVASRYQAHPNGACGTVAVPHTTGVGTDCTVKIEYY